MTENSSQAKAWLEKHYPVPANDPTALHSELAAAQHSLIKWRGLRPRVLAAHGLKVTGWGGVREIDASQIVLEIDSGSCALCQRHADADNNIHCSACSLFETVGSRCSNNDVSPWAAWCNKDNPEPMITALQQTVTRLSTKRSWFVGTPLKNLSKMLSQLRGWLS